MPALPRLALPCRNGRLEIRIENATLDVHKYNEASPTPALRWLCAVRSCHAPASAALIDAALCCCALASALLNEDCGSQLTSPPHSPTQPPARPPCLLPSPHPLPCPAAVHEGRGHRL
jgi:hypothetical protein